MQTGGVPLCLKMYFADASKNQDWTEHTDLEGYESINQMEK